MKKILSIFVSAILLVSCFVIPVSANENTGANTTGTIKETTYLQLLEAENALELLTDAADLEGIEIQEYQDMLMELRYNHYLDFDKYLVPKNNLL